MGDDRTVMLASTILSVLSVAAVVAAKGGGSGHWYPEPTPISRGIVKMRQAEYVNGIALQIIKDNNIAYPPKPDLAIMLSVNEQGLVVFSQLPYFLYFLTQRNYEIEFLASSMYLGSETVGVILVEEQLSDLSMRESSFLFDAQLGTGSTVNKQTRWSILHNIKFVSDKPFMGTVLSKFSASLLYNTIKKEFTNSYVNIDYRKYGDSTHLLDIPM